MKIILIKYVTFYKYFAYNRLIRFVGQNKKERFCSLKASSNPTFDKIYATFFLNRPRHFSKVQSKKKKKKT